MELTNWANCPYFLVVVVVVAGLVVDFRAGRSAVVAKDGDRNDLPGCWDDARDEAATL